MKKVIYDIETNGLTPDVIHCVVVKDIDTNKVTSFLEGDRDAFNDYCNGVDQFIGHNIIGYDNVWVRKLWGIEIPTEKSVDTLILSRMFNKVKEVRGKLQYTRKKNEHKLQAWGDGACRKMVDGSREVVTSGNHYFDTIEEAIDFAVTVNNLPNSTASMPHMLEDNEDYDDDVTECYITVEETTTEYLKVNKFAKGDFSEWEHYCPEMLEYCIQDVQLNHEIYKKLVGESRGFSKQSIRLEHKLVEILTQQMQDGFKIDVKEAKQLLLHCTHKCDELEAQMQKDFPPLPKLKKEYYPRLNKDGKTYNTGSMGYMKEYYGLEYNGEPYSAIEWVTFNLSSPIQVVERLRGFWKPTEKSKGGAWTLSDKNLETINDNAPASIKKIKTYRMYASRCNELKQWIEGAEKHDDHRLRGRIVHLGSWSGRASHSGPNTANISSVQTKKIKTPDDLRGLGNEGTDWIWSDDKRKSVIILGEKGNFGYECRSLWVVEPGNVLVGCDASGIQLRILAHYINNEEYTKQVLNEIHDFNARILGTTRVKAKKFIYSWLLGAGVMMTADILGCKVGQAYIKREQFVKLTPGLEEFLKVKALMSQRGWYKGLDGRKVYIPNEHLSTTAYLQNGEHVIMALANIYWQKWAKEAGIPFKQCGYIHDEWQVETPEQYGHLLGALMKKSFRIAGEFLNLNCPLDGAYNIGRSWAGTH